MAILPYYGCVPITMLSFLCQYLCGAIVPYFMDILQPVFVKAFSFCLELAELLLFAISFMGKLMGSAVISQMPGRFDIFKFCLRKQ